MLDRAENGISSARACIEGILTVRVIPLNFVSLALAELFITIATVFQRFDLELHNTTRDDIDIKHDLFIPRPKNLNTLGVQVRVKR